MLYTKQVNGASLFAVRSQPRYAAGMEALLRGLIRAYQLLLRPVLGNHCRYEPSCSHYASEAIAMHGAWRGTWLTLRRLGRCHPWGGHGWDPVPERKQ